MGYPIRHRLNSIPHSKKITFTLSIWRAEDNINIHIYIYIYIYCFFKYTVLMATAISVLLEILCRLLFGLWRGKARAFALMRGEGLYRDAASLARTLWPVAESWLPADVALQRRLLFADLRDSKPALLAVDQPLQWIKTHSSADSPLIHRSQAASALSTATVSRSPATIRRKLERALKQQISRRCCKCQWDRTSSLRQTERYGIPSQRCGLCTFGLSTGARRLEPCLWDAAMPLNGLFSLPGERPNLL